MRGIVTWVLALAVLGCGRSAPPPPPEEEPPLITEPAVVAGVQEATASCQSVVKAVEQVRDMKTAEAAIGVIRGELPKLRKLRERLPESLPAGPTLPPATVEFLEAMVRLTDAEIRVIEAARDRRLPIADGAFDQILMELRRYTDELHHIRNRIAPTPA